MIATLLDCITRSRRNHPCLRAAASILVLLFSMLFCFVFIVNDWSYDEYLKAKRERESLRACAAAGKRESINNCLLCTDFSVSPFLYCPPPSFFFLFLAKRTKDGGMKDNKMWKAAEKRSGRCLLEYIISRLTIRHTQSLPLSLHCLSWCSSLSLYERNINSQ